MIVHRWLLLLVLVAGIAFSPAAQYEIPEFGRDTVLVWNIRHQEYESEFVVRIAEFAPDRFIEWEDPVNQGTVLIPSSETLNARGYAIGTLFKSGVDTRAKDTTTLWLSGRIFRELKEKNKAKCYLDGVQTSFVLKGEDQLQVEVNRTAMSLPVIRVMDGRGAERWFLDQEKNPLMLKYQVRQYTQTLSSITTNRKNTLRWIKGRKLER